MACLANSQFSVTVTFIPLVLYGLNKLSGFFMCRSKIECAAFSDFVTSFRSLSQYDLCFIGLAGYHHKNILHCTVLAGGTQDRWFPFVGMESNILDLLGFLCNRDRNYRRCTYCTTRQNLLGFLFSWGYALGESIVMAFACPWRIFH